MLFNYVNGGLKRTWKEVAVAYFKISSIFLEGLGKTKERKSG
jgi:hypothetical protein